MPVSAIGWPFNCFLPMQTPVLQALAPSEGSLGGAASAFLAHGSLCSARAQSKYQEQVSDFAIVIS